MPDETSPDTLERRKRLHHAWSEASNPHDALVARAGKVTVVLIVLALAWLLARNAGWI
jgi:hypothetical protein